MKENNRIEYKQELNLSFEQLRIYYEEKRKPLNRQFKTNLELLNEDGFLNYAAYLLADENGMSIKLAKFAGKTRVDLIEANEYGYCSLIKATKSVLDKFELENKTATKITSKERIEKRLWNSVAIREAVINAIVHNDYTREVPPKFEIFTDRIEITSAGSLPEGLSEEDFFDGVSIPRNKELMRIYNDLELVEQLGTGVGRILETYGRECFRFTENFTRITVPIEEETGQAENDTVSLENDTVNAENDRVNAIFDRVNIENDRVKNELMQIYCFIEQNPLVKIASIEQLTQKSDKTVRRYLKILKDNKLIEYIGSDKTGGYQIIKIKENSN